MVRDKLLEKAADISHDSWSRWTKYLFSKCYDGNQSGSLVIPRQFVNRWKRQLNTPYSKLSEEEKESDRVEAWKYIELVRRGNNDKR